jgi:N-acetyl-anhydromuramyl-L-alanine amidase AmpD
MSALLPNAFSDFKFVKPSRPIDRVFVHCSASDYPHHDNIATMRQWHLERGWSDVGYHFFIRKDGTLEIGRPIDKTPAAQAGHNRGTIAICLHGLSKDKFTAAQKATLRTLCVLINQAYAGRLTFHGHCEVANKSCPVLDYGDVLKLTSKAKLGYDKASTRIQMPGNQNMTDLEAPEAKEFPDHILLMKGSRGPNVTWLQTKLKELGYPVGKIDGKFEGMTRTAVLSFQADNHLLEDGKVGNSTYEALEDAQPRPIALERQKQGLVDLAKGGSRIAQASISQATIGGAIGLGGIASVVEETSGTVSKLTNGIGVFDQALQTLGPWLGAIVVVGGIVIVLQALKAGRARVQDHRTGRTA